MALWASTEPVVATFHSAMLRSRALHAAHPLLRPSLEKIRGRIAVSEDARATVQRHLGGEAFIIPNGVYVDDFRGAVRTAGVERRRRRRRRWPSSGGSTSRARASRWRSRRCRRCSTSTRVPGCSSPARATPRTCCRRRTRAPRRRPRCWARSPTTTRPPCCARSTPTWRRTSAARASASCSSRRWPPGRPVVASDLPAFAAVLDGGRTGVLFETGSPDGLSRARARPARRPRAPRGTADRRARAGPGCSTGASSPTGSWPSTRRSSPAPTASRTSQLRHGLWGRLVRGVPGGGN